MNDTNRRRHLPERDSGAALIIVVVWGAVLLMLVGILAQATVNAVRPSQESEYSYAALAAAEAGLEDYRARLLADNRYFLRTDASNPALTGWAPMPGGAGAGEFSYAVDTSRAMSAGQLRVSSTGRAGGVTRTVEEVLTKRSTLDYVYISDIETWAPSLPGAYADLALADRLCANRRWREFGPVNNTTGTGLHRNSNYCRWAGIYSSERLNGRVHTNDVWYLDPNIPNIDPLSTGGNATAVFNGKVTTSCPAPTSTTAGCPPTQRWINYNDVRSGDGTWSSSSTYQTTETSTSYPNKLWNPQYDTVLAIPASNSRMKELAQSGGCVYTGPTRIRLRSNGNIEVTSPATKSTSALCGGSSLYVTPSTTNPAQNAVQPTWTGNLATMKTAGFNGVIYVQGTVSPGAGDPNYSASGTAATCQKKTATSVNSYPFVIPSLEASELFNSSYFGKKGFPSELYGSPAAWFDCNAGDAYVQGELSGAVTIATENNIGLTGHTRDSLSPMNISDLTTYGVPPLTSDNLLGLVPTKFLYAYRPLTAAYAETADWDYTKTRNVVYNFAAVALGECFGSMDATKGRSLGNIYMRGSLGQKYRCPVGVGTSSGYQKNYVYDQRFTVEDPPPYMLELSSEPWKLKAISETTIRRDPVATAGLTADSGSQARNTTRSWNVVANDTNVARLKSVQIARGQGTASVVNGQVSFTAPSTLGQTVIEYVVERTDGTIAAHTLTITLI